MDIRLEIKNGVRMHGLYEHGSKIAIILDDALAYSLQAGVLTDDGSLMSLLDTAHLQSCTQEMHDLSHQVGDLEHEVWENNYEIDDLNCKVADLKREIKSLKTELETVNC